MPRFPDRLAAWRLAWALPALLAGCAVTPTTPLQPLTAEQQRSFLHGLPGFSFSGRVAVATADQGSTPSVEWRQQREDSRVRLTGPLGAGSLQIDFSPQQLQLQTSRGERLMDADAELVLERELGFVPPFNALRYWIRGVPAPGAAAAIETYDAAGVLLTLSQHDWLISYQRRVTVSTAAGRVQLPALLTATRDGLRLRLVIDRWRIR
jgi:outer membrane lipoprotein LolB